MASACGIASKFSEVPFGRAAWIAVGRISKSKKIFMA
jgi:hypothetical protein